MIRMNENSKRIELDIRNKEVKEIVKYSYKEDHTVIISFTDNRYIKIKMNEDQYNQLKLKI